MGLKEKIVSESTGKSLVGVFFATQVMDAAMTKADLVIYHGTEVSPIGGAEIMNFLGQDHAIAVKIALSALLIGAYALTSIHEQEIKLLSQNIRLKNATEKALQGETVFMAGVLSWDALNLGADVASKIKF